MIGYDGFAANLGNSKYFYAGQSGIYAGFSNKTGLRITNTLFQKRSPNVASRWVNMSTIKVTSMPDSNYTLAATDEMIIMNDSVSADRTLELPTTQADGAEIGRQIWVKDYSQHSITIYCPNKLIQANGNSATSSITINNTASMFLFDGNYWLQFYCG